MRCPKTRYSVHKRQGAKFRPWRVTVPGPFGKPFPVASADSHPEALACANRLAREHQAFLDF